MLQLISSSLTKYNITQLLVVRLYRIKYMKMKKNEVRGKFIRIYNSVDSGEKYNFIFFGSSVVVPLALFPMHPGIHKSQLIAFSC